MFIISIILFYSMKHSWIIFLLTLKIILSCDTNCAFCPQNGTSCLACNTNFTLTQTGICIAENTIPNCATYDQSMNCLVCKPTFSTIWNMCQRMFDGCLINKNGKCVQCLPGGILNFMTGACSVQYLNCIQIDSQGACTACQPRYTLNNGKCVYQSTSCSFLDKNTGLCTQCTPGSVLVGAVCVPSLQVLDNCYMMDDSQTNLTCRYCKQGYGVYNGACQTFARIINSTQNLTGNCTSPDYLENNQQACASLNPNFNCVIFDFGASTCVYCQAGFNLINGTCTPMINNFCLVFSSNGMNCQTCKQTFFLKNGQCNPYPPFCISYSNVCTQCQSNFQLVNGNCVDPNCQTVNAVTRACQICVVNYKLNPNGVCKFIDPNCQQFNTNGDCLLCLKGYSVRSSLQYCVYQDLNCLTFNNVTGSCILCKPFYAYNEQVQLCVPLPDNCQTADLSGRCSKCMSGFNLISNYNCLFIPSIPNCQMISKDDYSKCVLCNNGSYANANGVCKPLPIFCSVYDSVNNQCLQCNDNGLMKDGNCVDKNCQIFDLQGVCLACITSFQFNSFGQCNYAAKDPNCKVFSFGICQSCMQRYYFNFQFVCIAVSPLCKSYDPNSGFCLTCYDGYQLSQNGGCYIEIYNSVVGTNDFLSTSCKTYDNQGQCIECYFGYTGISISNTSKAVNCVQVYQSSNSYCINIDQNTGKCNVCVSRMFVNSSGSCQSVDENCNTYNQTTGACITCYPGYQNKFDRGANGNKCTIVSDADPNCQTKGNVTGCLKCYSGFYYSLESLKCVQVNQLCSTYNSTTGQCLSCYEGYTLIQGNCKITKSSSVPSFITNATQSSISALPNGCLQMNTTTNTCRNCDWGYALINGSCYQKDLNCQTFAGPDSVTCLTCYDGYKPFGSTQSQCVLTTLIIDHCLKYYGSTANLTCILCENGYILSQAPTGVSPPFTCNLIDQNCAVYNSTANICQTCAQGTVLSGRTCIAPTYGVDPNCIFYTNKLCTACRTGWSLSGYLCAQT